MIIAIDGPAGAGKSSVTKALAQKMGIARLDTGALYRAIALAASRANIKSDDERIGEFVSNTDVSFKAGQVRLDGVDVSKEIRADHVSALASEYASVAEVRAGLLNLQRSVALQGDFIVDGRDIGTVVFPDAEVKLYLTASVDARAHRRFLEYAGQPDAPSLEQIRSGIVARDDADTNREIAPLRIADDALIVDSSSMTLDEVVAYCLKAIEEKLS